RLIELLDLWPSERSLQLNPPEQRQAIDRWREQLQGPVNDGVYRCGFARNQDAYNGAEEAFWATLASIEELLRQPSDAEPSAAGEEDRGAEGPWLAGGSTPSLADVQLFPTLVRLELVYGPLFGVSRRPLWQLPALWQWRRRFFSLPGVASTCFPEAWRRDYFGALFPLHPSGIIPAGPELSSLLSGTPPPGGHPP
ncbi:MAG: glutathione S-transferase family protein, partial [Cyanobium sp.]